MKFNRKRVREEYARQVLLTLFTKKYQDSFLADKPDIQNLVHSIGVEVTNTMDQRLQYGIAQFSPIYNKHISTVTPKKKEQLQKHKVKLDTDENGIIKFILPEAFWGSGNRTKEAFISKQNKLNEGNYKIFKENNLFLFAENEEEDEILELIEYIQSCEKSKRNFNLIYIYTYKELFEISTYNYSYRVFSINAEQKEHFLLESVKALKNTN